mmetsp:Transcript_17783/g.51752  ORF Transcript_17783/g.51752 Transcript_17783/m.51752 type:complete len:90 (+) Transcript_17783:352-621(+)
MPGRRADSQERGQRSNGQRTPAPGGARLLSVEGIDGPLEFVGWGDAWRRQEGHDSAVFTCLSVIAVVLDLGVGWVRACDIRRTTGVGSC